MFFTKQVVGELYLNISRCFSPSLPSLSTHTVFRIVLSYLHTLHLGPVDQDDQVQVLVHHHCVAQIQISIRYQISNIGQLCKQGSRTNFTFSLWTNLSHETRQKNFFKCDKKRYKSITFDLISLCAYGNKGQSIA